MTTKDNPEKPVIEIDIMEDGPFIVKNLTSLKKSSGEEIACKDVIALCRCGASANKPFCDGTHKNIGYSGEREIDKPLMLEKSYKGKKITIHDNRVICAHAANCVNNLGTVFSLNNRPWINADGDSVENIIKAIKNCPSGALSYTLEDQHVRDNDDSPQVRICKNGPYHVMGTIHLNIEDDMQPPSREHYTLCRCGASKNKPYCDGSHHDAEFKDPEN